MQNEKSFDTGELSLNYFEGGTGEPLVLLHGLTGRWQALLPLITSLTTNWHVYAPDLRGHGASGRAPDNQYGNADYARDVIAFLKMIGEPVVLVGHSLGAMTGIVTASRYPEAVRALVLLDPPLFSYIGSVHLQPDTANWFNLVASVNQGDPSRETRIARMREAMPDVPDEQVSGTADFIAGVAPGAPETALRDEIWQGVDLPQTLQAIHCPTLMIWGEWDRGGAVRETDADFLKQNLPSAETVKLPDADHGLKMQQQPEWVLKPINEFLQSIR